jgi:hypothetical protein
MGNSNYIKNFRSWLQEMWMQHKDELDSLGIRCEYDMVYYFSKYKYWLKREYKHQMRKES